jgi:hypothetical protein
MEKRLALTPRYLEKLAAEIGQCTSHSDGSTSSSSGRITGISDNCLISASTPVPPEGEFLSARE